MLNDVGVGKKWHLEDKSIVVMPEELVYVQPTFKVISGNPRESKFLVISSAGAVGKSALAAHLANEKNAIVWNLSKVRLGTNSFLGTLAKIFGAKSLTDVLSSISRGETLLVFDALDEAEIHSGREGVEIFVREVVEHCGTAGGVSVMFLGRPDSAKRVVEIIGALFPLALAHVAIGYFNKDAAAKFCYETYVQARTENPASEEVFRKKLESFFGSGLSGVEVAGAAWSEEDSQFYGYAPVLQAVAIVLGGVDNLHAYNLQRDNPRGVFLSEIMQSIMLRESAKFHENVSTLSLSASVGQQIYSEDDQALRLLKYSIGDAGWDQAVCASAEDSQKVSAAIQSFLPQHPFVREATLVRRGVFSGPAFRDYCLARALCSSSEDLRTYAEVFLIDNGVMTSPVLFDVYLSKGRGVVRDEHVDALYLSFAAVEGKSECFLDLYGAGDQVELVLSRAQEYFLFEVKGDGVITFSGSLCNAQIDIDKHVAIDAVDAFEIADSEVFAKQISVRASSLGVRGRVFLAATNVNLPLAAPVVVRLRADGATLSVNFPGSERHPWSDFHSVVKNVDEDDESLRIAHTLNRILRWFRKDKRAELARYRDLIRKHIVGRGVDAQRAFDFLEHIGAVEERGNLYVLRSSELDKYGIRWAGAATDPDTRLTEKITEYLREL